MKGNIHFIQFHSRDFDLIIKVIVASIGTLNKQVLVIDYQPETYEALNEDPYVCIKRHIAACHRPLVLNSSSLSKDQSVHQWHVFSVKDVPTPSMENE